MITERTQRNSDEERNRFVRPFTRRNLLGGGSSAAAALLAAQSPVRSSRVRRRQENRITRLAIRDRKTGDCWRTTQAPTCHRRPTKAISVNCIGILPTNGRSCWPGMRGSAF